MPVCGFTTTLTAGSQLYGAGVRPTTALACLGLAAAALGAFGLIYAAFLLESSVSHHQRGEFTTRGMYRVVRHPLYLSGIVINAGMVLMGLSSHGLGDIQHLIRVDLYLLLDCAGIVFFWLAAKIEDHDNIVRFGEPYRQYIADVPGLNPLKGWRRLKARKHII